MGARGLKWSAVGVVSLLLVALGVHLGWEHHRYRLSTPKGTIRIGMTRAEVEAVLGPANPGSERVRWTLKRSEGWFLEGDRRLLVSYDGDDRVEQMHLFGSPDEHLATLPRPSLVKHVRFWLPGWPGGE
jgi:hypothetical protein